MTEQTIVCPNCKTEIKLTESLAAPLIEDFRKQYEQQLTVVAAYRPSKIDKYWSSP